MSKSAATAQKVVTALETARELSFQLAQAMRDAQAAIEEDGTAGMNIGRVIAASGAVNLVESTVITELTAWQGYLRARLN